VTRYNRCRCGLRKQTVSEACATCKDRLNQAIKYMLLEIGWLLEDMESVAQTRVDDVARGCVPAMGRV
jgi:hypothetical protein